MLDLAVTFSHSVFSKEIVCRVKTVHLDAQINQAKQHKNTPVIHEKPNCLSTSETVDSRFPFSQKPLTYFVGRLW